MILDNQYCLYSDSVIWNTLRSTTSRSWLPELRSKTRTGKFDRQYWRSPRNILAKSAIVRLSTVFFGCTITATSCAVCAKDSVAPANVMTAIANRKQNVAVLAIASLEGEGRLDEHAIHRRIRRSVLGMSIFPFKCRKVGDVKTNACRGTH